MSHTPAAPAIPRWASVGALMPTPMPMPMPRHDELEPGPIRRNSTPFTVFEPPRRWSIFETDAPLPDEWKLPESTIPRLIFQALCLTAYGRNDLQNYANVSAASEEVFIADQDRIAQRITTITVVAGLLLGPTAAFLTTTPPLPDKINYNRGGPYVCLICSLGITIGALIVGSAEVFVLTNSNRQWCHKTNMATRLNVWCTIFLLAYPFLSIGVATMTMAFGLLFACWTSQSTTIRIAGVFMLASPLLCAFLFVIIQIPQKRKASIEEGFNHRKKEYSSASTSRTML